MNPPQKVVTGLVRGTDCTVQWLLRLALVFVVLVLNRGAAEVPVRLNLEALVKRLGYESVELRRTGDNHLYVSGRLNHRRCSVLVDTGWSFTTISTNAARQLKRHDGSDVASAVALFPKDGNSEVVWLDNLKLGPVEFARQPALVQHIMQDGQAAPFDLVLGCDFLIRNFAIVDCRNRRLYVRRAPPSPQQRQEFAAALDRCGFVAIGMKRREPLALTCQAHVNGEAMEMLVDSAAVWSCLDARQVRELGLRVRPTAGKLRGVGATGTRGVAVAEARTFALGDATLNGLNFAVLDLADWGFAAPGERLSEVKGILGGRELALFHAVMDCDESKLWVKWISPGK